MLRVLAASAVVVLLAGCSSGAATSSSSSTGGAGSPTASGAASSAPSAAPSSAAPAGGLTIVSQGLKKDGAQVILDASQADSSVFASVLSQTNADDYDAGLAVSTDGGATWRWGGFVPDKGKTFPEGVVATGDGAVMVGSTEVTSGSSVSSKAFLAVANAPDFAPQPLSPKEFEGDNIHLQDVAIISGTWIVVGWQQAQPDAKGQAPRTSFLWRSGDKGATWTRTKLEVPDSVDNSVEQIVEAPDGSWNIVGQAVFGDGSNQYDPIWLKSTDAGNTFTLTNKDAFAAPLDQGATRIEFAGDGSAAVLGWDEVTDGNAARASALWVSGADQKLQRIGTTSVPVSGGTPPGEFIDGILWDNTTLAAWGSPTGSYPMDNVQFWGLTKDGLTQSTMLPGNGTPLAISRIIVGKTDTLAFGFTGKDLAGADAAVWKGTTVQ